MATLTDHRKTVRLIAYNAKLIHTLKTVNVSTSQQADAKLHWPEIIQATAAQIVKDIHHAIPTWMVAGSTTKGLPTVYVNGYTGPS